MSINHNGHLMSKDAYRATIVEAYLFKAAQTAQAAQKAELLLRLIAALLPGDGLSPQCLVDSDMRKKVEDGCLEQALYDLLEKYGKTKFFTDMLPTERTDRSLVNLPFGEIMEDPSQ